MINKFNCCEHCPPNCATAFSTHHFVPCGDPSRVFCRTTRRVLQEAPTVRPPATECDDAAIIARLTKRVAELEDRTRAFAEVHSGMQRKLAAQLHTIHRLERKMRAQADTIAGLHMRCEQLRSRQAQG